MIVSIRKPLKKQYTDKTYIAFYVEGPILRYRNQIHNLVNTRERLIKSFSYFYQVSIKFPYFLW